MTDRRRNFFILLLVGALLAGSIAVIVTSKTREGLDLKGGVELVYQAKPTKFSQVTGDAMARTIDIMRDRVDQLGVAEPEIQRSGSDQIDVALPDVTNAARAAQQVGTTAQMFFYDWEPNVLGPGCKPNPTDQNTTGGSAAGQAGAATLSYYAAVVRASKCPQKANQNTSTDTPSYYLVDDKAQQVLAGPEASESEIFTEPQFLKTHQKAPLAGQSIKSVQPGTAVVEAEYDKNAPKNDVAGNNSAQWYVINDNFALRGTDIKDPQQTFDNGTGGTGAPIVTFNFTDKGKKIWQDVTKKIAERGNAQQIPGQDPQSAFQHFGVVLDNKLITVPYISFVENPGGIDASNGSQI